MAAEDSRVEQNHRLPSLVVGAVGGEHHVDVVLPERKADISEANREPTEERGFEHGTQYIAR